MGRQGFAAAGPEVALVAGPKTSAAWHSVPETGQTAEENRRFSMAFRGFSIPFRPDTADFERDSGTLKEDVHAMRLGRLPSALRKGRQTSTVTLRWSDGREAGTFLPKFLRENTQDARLQPSFGSFVAQCLTFFIAFHRF